MEDTEDDGGYLAFDTRFRKCPDEPAVLEWTVGLRRYRGDGQENPGELLAA